MVGKLNDMVTAAAVVESTPKTTPVEQQEAARVKQEEAKLPKTAQQQQEEEKEKQGRIAPGTMSEQSVLEMTETFNELMDKINVNLEFSYNREADMMNVKMIDKETKEVIKEFPPEEMIENMIKTKDWLGAFIDRAI